MEQKDKVKRQQEIIRETYKRYQGEDLETVLNAMCGFIAVCVSQHADRIDVNDTLMQLNMTIVNKTKQIIEKCNKDGKAE